jgi:SAM-dependent methyltransferase
LKLDPKGYWVTEGSSALSYPEEGNNLYFALEDDSFWFRHRNHVIIAVMRQFAPPGPLFDIGGGNGYVAFGIERAGFPTVLVEPGRAGAENACRRGLRHVICATTEEAGFVPGTMDAVGLFDVLEHIRDDVVFLASLRRLMRSGARIYLTVPAFQLLWSREDEFAGHYRRYTSSALAKVLQAAGFAVEYLTYFFWFLPLPVLLLRSIPSRFGWRGHPSPQSARREHSASGGLAGWLVERALSCELAWLARGRTLPFGGSCLAVARSLE